MSVHLGIGEHNKIYMKNLLFVLCSVVLTTLFYSCEDDDKNDDPQTQTETEIVQNAIKGKFYNTGIEAYKFNDKTVDMWSNIVNGGEYYQYANIEYSIYPEKQYIVIKTTPETLLYYEIVNNKVLLYTDAERKNNITDTEKPNDFTNESKEPIEGIVTLTTDNTTVDFNTWEYQSINSDRLMYIKDLNGKTILTLNWYQYQNIKDISNVGTVRNLVGFSQGKMYIKDVFDSESKSILYGEKDAVSVKLYKTETKNNIVTVTLKIDIDNEKGKVKGYTAFSYNK